MSNFGIDLLTGNVYLFAGIQSGVTINSGTTIPQVNLYSNLPSPDTASGEVYLVRSGSGSYMSDRKPSGFYFSNGADWKFLGDTIDFFKSDNFQIFDSVDSTKGVKFITSGISSNVKRNVTIQDSDGTLAYLSDIQNALVTKLDVTTFNNYSANTITNNNTIQLISTSTDNVNTIIPTTIIWSNATNTYPTDIYAFTGGSDILIKQSGVYDISYHVLLKNDNVDQTHSIGGYITINDNPIQISNSVSIIEGINMVNVLSLTPIWVEIGENSVLNLQLFRIGDVGVVNLISGKTLLKISKIS